MGGQGLSQQVVGMVIDNRQRFGVWGSGGEPDSFHVGKIACFASSSESPVSLAASLAHTRAAMRAARMGSFVFSHSTRDTAGWLARTAHIIRSSL